MLLLTCNAAAATSLFYHRRLRHQIHKTARFAIVEKHKWRARLDRGALIGFTTRVHCSNHHNSQALLKDNEDNGGAVAGGSSEQNPVVVGVEKDLQLLHLKEILRLAQSDLERARVNSAQLEAEAQRFAERAIALGDEAANALSVAKSTKALLQDRLLQEAAAQDALDKAGLALSAAKSNIKLVEQTLDNARLKTEGTDGSNDVFAKDQQAVNSAWLELQKSEETFRNCQLELSRIQDTKLQLQRDITRLDKLAEAANAVALAADDDVSKAMSLAEEAVALEVEAAKRLSDAEIALQKAEGSQLPETSSLEASKAVPMDEPSFSEGSEASEAVELHASEDNDSIKDASVSVAERSAELEKKAKELLDNKRVDGDLTESVKTYPQKTEGKQATSDFANLKSFTKKSSRFFPASFFSFDESEEFSPSTVFSGLMLKLRQNLSKVVVGGLFLLGGTVYLGSRVESLSQVVQTYEISANIEEVALSTKPFINKLYKIPSRIKVLVDKLSQQEQEVNEEEASLFDVLWLLLASVIFVPIFQKIPGGSPVLGYLAAGVLIGPHSLHIIRNVHGTKSIAEFGVVFLLFNIGLELSVERLSSMRKYVFGFGSSQVLATALVCGLFAYFISGLALPASIVIGNGLALSSTAVVLQVLQERGESTSRHGRAAFSVLLFQDLAVVVLLILIPLISPNSSRGGAGLNAIAEALGIAAVKGIIAISGIIAGGRLLLRPIYHSMAENHNAEIFAANTLLVVLGTSVLTARAGLSMALGAFLAGLLLSETEYALQVESDIAPYRGLLLGLFFMTVGMSIDPQLFVAKSTVILGSLALLIVGKTLLIACLGRQFGLSNVAALRTGLLLAPGGEFAFVAFGEAVNQGIMSQQLSSLLFLVVGLSMAFTPWLAALGQVISTKFDQQDVRSLLPAENETDDLEGHVIVCGFGRVGQIISQMLSERLIPFVALDVRSERVSMGRALDLPVYFGDAGSKEVLHKLGADRAATAVITLDTPGANYRAVWALSRYFPKVKTYVRAHDVDHGINLEKAGATAVVPETLEPSLQLAAAILAEAKLPAAEIAATINEFRSRHLAELTELTKKSGTSLGYGYSQSVKGKSDDDGSPDRRFEGVVAVP